MDKQKEDKLFNYINAVVNGYIDDEETSGWIAGYLINWLRKIDEPNEVNKPVIIYSIRFHNYTGELECVKETLHNNYQEGNIINYKDSMYEIYTIEIYEDENKTDVIINAHRTSY